MVFKKIERQCIFIDCTLYRMLCAHTIEKCMVTHVLDSFIVERTG